MWQEDCLICTKGGEDSGDCKKRNLTYQTFCLPCKEQGKTSKYVGESARTGHERGLEHWRDYQKEQEDSHMAKHWLADHPGQDKPQFGMKVVQTHKSAFSRQVHEAILIEMADGQTGDSLLNSKGEFNRCELPRLTVQIGQRTWTDRQDVEEVTEMDEEQ